MTAALLLVVAALLLVGTGAWAKPAACVVRLGTVAQLSGPLMATGNVAAYQLAIDRINAGAWASGSRPFALGAGLPACTFDLVVLDDASNVTLHALLVQQLLPAVDFLLVGSTVMELVLASTAYAAASGKLTMVCCLGSDQAFSAAASKVFGLFRPVVNSVQPLLHLQRLSPGTARLAVVFSTTESINVEACALALNASSSSGLPVVFNATITTGSTTLPALVPLLRQSQATFLYACVELGDAVALASLVAPLQLEGQFFLEGPAHASFQRAPATGCTFSSAQWHPALPFSDALLGTAGAFSAAMAARGVAPVSDVECAAATSVELLADALIRAAQGQRSANVQTVLAAVVDKAAALLQGFQGTTLCGPVQFNALHRNVAGDNVITQLDADPVNGSALVLPSTYATALAVYPRPAATCVVRLGAVVHLTGASATIQALAGMRVAIERINTGRWAGSGQRDAGFALGSALLGCTFNLTVLDDESNVTLHVSMTSALASQVDLMLGPAQLSQFYSADEQVFQQLGSVVVMCCNPDLSIASPASRLFTLYAGQAAWSSTPEAFALFLASQGPTRVAVVASDSEASNAQQCAAFEAALTSDATVVLRRYVRTGDGSVNASLAADVAASLAQVVVGCLETVDAATLARYLVGVPLSAQFYTNGPGLPLFDTALNASAAYVLGSAQWVPSAVFHDDLLGDAATFQADVQALYATATASSVSASAAVAVELTYHALVQALAGSSTSSVALAISLNADAIAQAIAGSELPSLIGDVVFDASHANAGHALVVTQLQPTSSANDELELVAVLPSDGVHTLVYPAPAGYSAGCVVQLGLVHSATGALADKTAFDGFSAAVQRINAGDWADGTQPGFSLGESVHGCTYNLTALDDGSNATTHAALALQLAASVDVFLSGVRTFLNADVAAVAAVASDSAQPTLALFTDFPGLYLSAAALPACVFGMAPPASTALRDLARFLSFAFPRPVLAVVSDPGFVGGQDACSHGEAFAAQFGLEIVLVSDADVVNATVVDDFASALARSNATTLLACLEVAEAARLANLTRPLALAATYMFTGPQTTAFDAAVPDASFFLTSSVWHPSLPFNDSLLGDAAAFAATLGAVPRSLTVVAAVAIEVMHAALVQGTAKQFYAEKAQVLRGAADDVRAAMQASVASTLLGLVLFDEQRQNVGAQYYTLQVADASAQRTTVVLPSAVASAELVYPAPSLGFCAGLLGEPSPLDMDAADVPAGIKAECRAWEAAVRAGSATSSSSVLDGDNETQQMVCSTCASLYRVSACFGVNAVRNVTVFPYIRLSTCGETDADTACEALVGNRTANVVIPCDYAPWDSAAGIFAAVFLSFCFVVNVVFAGCVVRHRAGKAIQYAQFPLLLAFILGACLVSAFGLVFVGPATDAACQLRTWLFNASVVLCLCPLFLKAYRVWRIFENPKLKHLIITNLLLFKVSLCMLLAELVWLAIWTGVSPTQSTCKPVVYPGLATPVAAYECANTMSWFAIVDAVLLGLYVVSCVVLGLLTVNVSTVFAEKEVLFASVNIAIVGGIVAFLFFFTDLSMQALTALVAVGLGWCSTFSVGVLVGPKLYWVLVKGEDYVNAMAFNKETSQSNSELVNQYKDRLKKSQEDCDRLQEENKMLRLKLKMKRQPAAVQPPATTLESGVDAEAAAHAAPPSPVAAASRSEAAALV